jgi:hypothetical protein
MVMMMEKEEFQKAEILFKKAIWKPLDRFWRPFSPHSQHQRFKKLSYSSGGKEFIQGTQQDPGRSKQSHERPSSTFPSKILGTMSPIPTLRVKSWWITALATSSRIAISGYMRTLFRSA